MEQDCHCSPEEICICETDQNKNNVWGEICREFEEERNFVREYLSQNDEHTDLPIHPLVGFLERDIIPLLRDALLSTLRETGKQNCFDRQRTAFDPTDHIAEYLWTNNSKYPERIGKYETIHDMEWVQDYLKQNPRPLYPFHVIWSRDFAAIKIQSFMRGYWVRRRDDIQEVRQFWRQLKDEAMGSGTSISRRFYIMD